MMMKRAPLLLLALAAPALLSAGCAIPESAPVRYQDLTLSRSSLLPAGHGALETPPFRTDIRRPLEFRTGRLPRPVDTTHAGQEMVNLSPLDTPPPPGADPRGGRLVVETYSLPERTPLARVVHDEQEAGYRRTAHPGNRPVDAFLVRVTVERPYHPVMNVNVDYMLTGLPVE